MTTRRSRFLHLRTVGSINEKRFDGDPNEVRGRGEKTESLFGKGGSGNHGFPIYKGYNRIGISYSKFSNNSNSLKETTQDDFGAFAGILR